MCLKMIWIHAADEDRAFHRRTGQQLEGGRITIIAQQVARGGRIRPNYGYRIYRLQGQQTVVFEQHHALASYYPGQKALPGRLEESGGGPLVYIGMVK